MTKKAASERLISLPLMLRGLRHAEPGHLTETSVDNLENPHAARAIALDRAGQALKRANCTNGRDQLFSVNDQIAAVVNRRNRCRDQLHRVVTLAVESAPDRPG